jgi:hypothetical protein
MTSRRAVLPELSAYREGARSAFPWRAVNWAHVYIGAGCGGLICLILFIVLAGWSG